VIYDAGISDFQARISRSFAEGLAESGWHVEMTTASRQTPTDLSSYSLVAIGAPIYARMPSPPLTAYLERLETFDGKQVAITITGAGEGVLALEYVSSLVAEMRGEPVLELVLYTQASNEMPFGSGNAVKIARDAALSLT